MNAGELLPHLISAVDGLFVMSESDGLFTVSVWPHAGVEPDCYTILADSGKPADAAVTDQSLDDALANRLHFYEEDQPRVDNLIALLTQNLSDIRVYYVGEIEIPLYIVGQASDGFWIVLKSSLTET